MEDGICSHIIGSLASKIITEMGEIMGQVIVINKTHLRYLLAGLFILLCCVCVSYPHFIYELLNLEEEKQYAPKKDIETYEYLTNKGSVFYVEFGHVLGRKYSEIAIYLYTLNEHQAIKIHELEFEFENKVKIVKVNNTIKLNQKPRLFIVEENPELEVEVFFDYSYFEQNSIKIYLQRIFKKRYKDIGKTIDMTLRINYSLDGGDAITQEIKYLVKICKGLPFPLEWIYLLYLKV
jgi:hypothetical protein